MTMLPLGVFSPPCANTNNCGKLVTVEAGQIRQLSLLGPLKPACILGFLWLVLQQWRPGRI